MASTSKDNAANKALDSLKNHHRSTDVDRIFSELNTGNRAALGEAITLIESTSEKHKKSAVLMLNKSLVVSGKSIRIGITGVPGVGKSTFIDAFGTYLTSIGKKVAVLAIDPSSPISKGSILGDKTRMERLSMDKNAFIRPSATSTTLGGVARKTRESIMLCEAAGYDIIIIETVGVGQSETAVHSMTDFFLLLMLAGAGDQLQGIKRGIMEMCDGMAITKADGDNRKKAEFAKSEYTGALHLFPEKPDGWMPKVNTCSALENKGIEETWKMIEDHHHWMVSRDIFDQHRNEQDFEWMNETLKELVLDEFFQRPEKIKKLLELKEQLLNRKITPFQAAEEMMTT
jgi:LAO/AO transport system kinase